MEIRPIASGSSGNCYFVSDGKTGILLDCGIPAKRIQKGLWGMGKSLSGISGCLITHAHSDHVYAAQKLADMGADIYASRGTIDAAGLRGHRVHEAEKDFRRISLEGAAGRPPYRVFSIGTLDILPFMVEHDAPEPLGFAIRSRAKDERLVYLTDAMYMEYDIRGVTHLMIEANYDEEALAENVGNGLFPASHAKRVINAHMGIEAALLALKRMDLGHLEEVWLLHLSDDNSSGDFKRRVQEVCGCEVYVA